MKYYLFLILFILFLPITADVNDLESHVFTSNIILNDDFEGKIEPVKNSDEKILVSDVLESQVGKLSRYGADCYGCSGYLAYGDYVGDGRIYYSDYEYGNVRILAADRKYPFGTIVRVNTTSDSFLGIVLDRGGAIGFGKIALFDLLYPSEYLANIDGVSYNTHFEILRYGFNEVM